MYPENILTTASQNSTYDRTIPAKRISVQWQMILENTNDLNTFQSGLRPCFDIVALLEEFLSESNRGSPVLLMLFHLSVAFDAGMIFNSL